jgi:hypothetical protein
MIDLVLNFLYEILLVVILYLLYRVVSVIFYMRKPICILEKYGK